MSQHWLRVRRKFLSGSSSGATLIEVVIAIVVLGMIAAAIPPVMVTVANAEFRRNEIKIGEIMTRNQFEYIKSQDYIWGNTTQTYPPQYAEATPPTESYYTVTVAEPIDSVTYERLIPDPAQGWVDDQGIQEITVTVFGFRSQPSQQADLRPLLVTKNYKVARELQW